MNCIIIHGCPSNVEKAMNEETRTYDKHWIPWIKKKLLEREIEVETPLMPEPWEPRYKDWKKEFEKLGVNEDTILIGHSGGCAFLVRWLGETESKIKKLFLVAPWKIPSPEFPKGENELYDFGINEKIKENVGDIIIFSSNNEEKDGKESAKIYNEALGGEVIELKGHGHYTIGDMKTEKFPELLDEILK